MVSVRIERFIQREVGTFVWWLVCGGGFRLQPFEVSSQMEVAWCEKVAASILWCVMLLYTAFPIYF